MIRDKYIVLSVSRLHYSNIAKLSLKGLKQFKDKNKENAAMALIMEERFTEKNASLLLRRWASLALGRANQRAALMKVKKVGEIAIKRHSFTRIIERTF